MRNTSKVAANVFGLRTLLLIEPWIDESYRRRVPKKASSLGSVVQRLEGSTITTAIKKNRHCANLRLVLSYTSEHWK